MNPDGMPVYRYDSAPWCRQLADSLDELALIYDSGSLFERAMRKFFHGAARYYRRRAARKEARQR